MKGIKLIIVFLGSLLLVTLWSYKSEGAMQRGLDPGQIQVMQINASCSSSTTSSGGGCE